MAATERVVVLMTPAEKRSLESKARRLGASAAEVVRRSVKAYDPDADDRELRILLDRFVEVHRSASAALDHAEREFAETRAYFASKAWRRSVSISDRVLDALKSAIQLDLRVSALANTRADLAPMSGRSTNVSFGSRP